MAKGLEINLNNPAMPEADLATEEEGVSSPSSVAEAGGRRPRHFNLFEVIN